MHSSLMNYKVIYWSMSKDEQKFYFRGANSKSLCFIHSLNSKGKMKGWGKGKGAENNIDGNKFFKANDDKLQSKGRG